MRIRADPDSNPDPVPTLQSHKVEFLHEKYTASKEKVKNMVPQCLEITTRMLK